MQQAVSEFSKKEKNEESKRIRKGRINILKQYAEINKLNVKILKHRKL